MKLYQPEDKDIITITNITIKQPTKAPKANDLIKYINFTQSPTNLMPL